MCEICKRYPCHPRCPTYKLLKTRHCCSICNEGIQNGEEYIVNDNDDYAHWECIGYAKDLVKFLGYEIKEMEENDEKHY